MTAGPRIFVDADACPVKDEIYKVARRYGLLVKVVANAFLMVPSEPLIERVIVDAGPDIADDWIADQAQAGDIVVTADIPLAQRCLAKAALVLSSRGKPFTLDSIGSALAGRAIGEHLRSMGEITGGPPPFGPADRSRFLQALDEAVHRARKLRR
ncbi:MAG TPA: YaiI/YqxD family protein [Caulobacteraceae bacterium]|nr:YaiI/YqxD family protein [Caulobacteraceae bacterium]